MKGSLRKVPCEVFGRHVRQLTAVAALVWIRRRAAAPGRTEPTLPTVVLRRGREYLLSPLLYDASVERVFHSDPNSSPLLTLTAVLLCVEVLDYWSYRFFCLQVHGRPKAGDLVKVQCPRYYTNWNSEHVVARVRSAISMAACWYQAQTHFRVNLLLLGWPFLFI